MSLPNISSIMVISYKDDQVFLWLKTWGMQTFITRVLRLRLRLINNQNLWSNFQTFQELPTKYNLRLDKFSFTFIERKYHLTSGLTSGLLCTE